MTKDEIKEKAEESFKKRLGTLGYVMAQNSINPYVDGYQDCFHELEKELENERKLNAEIKARFVKCNTCTQEMKDKCLMFTENLCEGERCEELVDIMSLIEKRESDDKLKLAKDIIKRLLGNAPDTYSGSDIELQQSKMFAFHNAVNEAEDFLREE